MTGPSPTDVVRDYLAAMNEPNWTKVAALFHPDYVEDYPQTGERIRGPVNAIAVRTGVLQGWKQVMDQERLVGGEPRWALSPNFTAIKVSADGDTVTSTVRATYPDGYWYVIYIAVVEGSVIRRATAYFAPTIEPPDWRKTIVEAIPDERG